MNGNDNAFPWAVVVSGFVAIAGIAGTLLSAHLTSRAAEKRRLAEQQYEDRTRFHKDRIEIYARFISAFKLYRESLIKQRTPPLNVVEEGLFELAPSPSKTRAAFAEVRETLLFISNKAVAQAAESVFGAATAMENPKQLRTTFDEWDQAALRALTEFRKVARAELLPDQAST
jgi:hypothetical protein